MRLPNWKGMILVLPAFAAARTLGVSSSVMTKRINSKISYNLCCFLCGPIKPAATPAIGPVYLQI